MNIAQEGKSVSATINQVLNDSYKSYYNNIVGVYYYIGAEIKFQLGFIIYLGPIPAP